MEQLGVQPLQLLTQIINFAILLFLLNKFLYKPVLKILNDRREKIEKGLFYTEKMQREAEKMEVKQEEINKQAKVEAKKIIDLAKKNAKEVETEIIEKAHKEASTIIIKAREELALEREEMERQLKIATVEIAQKWVESVLAKSLDTKSQMAIINKKIADMSKLEISKKN